MTGAIIVVTPEQQRDLVCFTDVIRKHQNWTRRRIGRLRRRVEQHDDLATGYLDLGGEG